MRSETMTDRELDAAVAVEVMGFSWSLDHKEPCWHVPPESPYFREYDLTRNSVPTFSTDIASAFAVVEKMRERGWFYTIADSAPLRSGRGNRKGKHFVRFFIRRTCRNAVTGDSLPRCICEAALAAVKGEGKEPCPVCGSRTHDFNGHTPNHD